MITNKRPGVKVKLTEVYKRKMIASGCAEHIYEFGDSVGVIVGPTYPHADCEEVDVSWLPFGIKFSYFPKDLEIC